MTKISREQYRSYFMANPELLIVVAELRNNMTLAEKVL